MLDAFGFERVGIIVVGDLYFVSPRAARGQEGAEHGVRLEQRVRAGELGHPPAGESPDVVRAGWL